MSKALKTLPAAVVAAAPSPKMSDRYVHINTVDVIQVMKDIGFGVAETKVDAVQKRDPAFARHMVTFRKELPAAERKVAEYVPQVLWINSHNGTVAARMALGVYRFVCLNGMVVGSTWEASKFKHSGDIARDVVTHVRSLTDTYGEKMAVIDSWKAKKLTKAKALAFATTASALRFGEDKAASYDPALLLGVRRDADDAGDAWTVFNRVQENASRGGFKGVNANGRAVTSKQLAGIGADSVFNAALWAAAEEVFA